MELSAVDRFVTCVDKRMAGAQFPEVCEIILVEHKLLSGLLASIGHDSPLVYSNRHGGVNSKGMI